MKTKKEVFEKITSGKNSGKFKRLLISEEVVSLNLEEIERMERNANKQIELSNQVIMDMQEKLKECEKLRLLITN